MPFESFIPYMAIAVFGTVMQAVTACEWITIKWKAANITNHDLQRALRAAYEDALSAINFAFRQRAGLLDKLGKNRLHKEITTSFNDQFLNPFITEKKLSTEEIKSLALNCSSYCKLLASSADMVLPLTEVSEVTIEDLLLTGRDLKGAEDLLKLNMTATAELIERIRLIEDIPTLFCDLLAYKGLLLGAIVFFFNERIKSDERVRSILMHSELQRIREENDRQHHKQIGLLEDTLKLQMHSFNICLTPFMDNLKEVQSSLDRVEATLEQNTKYLHRIYDILCQDRGVSEKDRKHLQAGLSTTFNLHDKYEFDESSPIGYGSVAVVYRAVHKGLHKVRALKVLKPEHKNNPEVVERFLREAMVLGSLNQPGIVKIYDSGGGGPNLEFYLEMEYVEGTTLRNFIETQPFNIDRVLRLIRQLGTAVQKIHEAGIIHRDLNPRNIMVTKAGDLKVMDFGVAKIVGIEGLTRDGQVVGTHDYMAPEQARSQRVDERADIYSIGVIIYELCTKHMPSTPLLPIRQYQIGVPQWLEDIVAKCLAQDRNKRYISAADILLAFDVSNTGNPPIATNPEEETQVAGRRAIPDRVTGKTVVSSDAAAHVARSVNVVEAESTDLIDPIAKPIITKTPVNHKAWVWISVIFVVLLVSIFAIVGYDNIYGFLTSANKGGYIEELANDNRSIALNPEEAQAYRDPELIINKQGDWDKVIADFTKKIEQNPKDANAYLSRGNAYYYKMEYDKAIADFTKAIELDPKFAWAYDNRGNTYIRKSDVDKAIADFTKAIELDPKHASAYNNRGTAYARKMEYDKAIADYTKAIELFPKYTIAYKNRGDTYSDKGNYEKAIADFTKVIEIDPKDVTAYNLRATAYGGNSEYDKAIADLTTAIELDPTYIDAYMNRAMAYSDIREYDEAIADNTKVIGIAPKYAGAYNNRGISYTNKGEYDKAIADLTITIELDPKNALPYNNRGSVYDAQMEYDKAIADFTTAIKVDPRYKGAYKNRGIAYAHKGENDKAIADFTKALEIDPKDVLVYLLRGDVYRIIGDNLKAMVDYQKAKDLGWK